MKMNPEKILNTSKNLTFWVLEYFYLTPFHYNIIKNKFEIVIGYKYKIWEILTLISLILRCVLIVLGLDEFLNLAFTSTNNLVRGIRWTVFYFNFILAGTLLFYTKEVQVQLNLLCSFRNISPFVGISNCMNMKHVYPLVFSTVGLGISIMFLSSMVPFFYCPSHFLEDMFLKCRNGDYWNNIPFYTVIFQTVSNFYFLGHIYASLLPFILIFLEGPIKMNLLIEGIREYECNLTYNTSNMDEKNRVWTLRYKGILIVCGFWNKFLRNIIFPSFINYIITNTIFCIVSFIILRRMLHPIILITYIVYSIAFFTWVYFTIKKISEITEQSKFLIYQHVSKLNTLQSRNMIEYTRKLPTAKLRIGDFHVFGFPIFCMMIDAVTKYTVELLITAT